MRSDPATLVPDGKLAGAPPKLDNKTSRLRQARRPTSAMVVPMALAVLAAGFAYEALQDRSALTTVVVASSRVIAGSVLGPSDTRIVRVHASDGLIKRGLVSPAELPPGWVAAVPLSAGQVVTINELRKPSRDVLGQMSIAVPAQQAAGGGINAGDEVDVIASNGAGEAYYVAQSLRVLAVAPSPSPGVLSGVSSDYFVVVAVDKQTALRVAAAMGPAGSGGNVGTLQIVRSTGEAPTLEPAYPLATPEPSSPTGGQR